MMLISVVLFIISSFNLFNILQIKKITENKYPEFLLVLNYVISSLGYMIAIMGVMGFLSPRRVGSMGSMYSYSGSYPSSGYSGYSGYY